MKKSSLTLVGSGIKFLSHLTIETQAYIKQSDRVLYLVNEPLMKEWIQLNNVNSESLDHIYTKYDLRIDCYNAMKDHILDTLNNDEHICVVLYGHPTVFAYTGLEAIKLAKQKGHKCLVLPAISAEDCLFADLLIDPGSHGCQSYEATDFLLRKRPFSPNSHLILWQIGIIGALGHTINHDNQSGIALLTEHLLKHYPLNHTAVIYEAAQYPSFEPRIEHVELLNLTHVGLTRISTLYVPPSENLNYDKSMLKHFDINTNHL